MAAIPPPHVAAPSGNWALLGLIGFYATEAVLSIFDLYGYSRVQQAWGLPVGSHVWLGVFILLVAFLAIATRRISAGALSIGFVAIGIAAGHAFVSDPPSWTDALWYALPAVVVGLTRGFAPASVRDFDATAYLLAAIVLNAAVLNAFNYGNVQAEYVRWGFPPWWNYMSAGYELVVGIALVFRASRMLAVAAYGALVVVIVATLVLAQDWWKLVEMGYFAVPTVLLVRHYARRHGLLMP